ncbi:MAG TPA: flagellar hook-associated protein FlgK [Herbaspirillum sp.]|jgi:flagellar hook-associated protein 1 FlgK
MASNILSIGESALFAAQQQLATTSHNISNAGVAGYSRQVVQQASAGSLNQGFGFVGTGTKINDVTRVYDGFLTKQILTAQTSASAYAAYAAQVGQIDDIVADPDAGLSLSLASFFKSLQDLTANPDAAASRQAALSGSQLLAARFQSLAATLNESRSSVNAQVSSNVDAINSYATQIAKVNASITAAIGATGDTPNDLLDQRDQLVASLNQIVKVTTQPQSNGGVDIMIGNGQPLVMGDQVSKVVTVASRDDPSRLGLGVESYNNTISLPDTAFSGGTLSGLLQYRSETLDVVQNTLGRIATVLASSMNDQNKLGVDGNGLPGGDIFSIAAPKVLGRAGNSATAALTASVTDASKLTTSDYRMQFDGTNYTVTRLSDGAQTVIPDATYPTAPAPEIDGVTFPKPTMAAGDVFTIQPTVDAASSLTVSMTDTDGIATAAPIATSKNTANTGSGTISAGSVDKNFLSSTVTLPLTATFGTTTPPALPTTFVLTDGASPTPNTITTGVTINGVAVTGSPIPYTPGATVTYQGMSFVMGGAPGSGDSFTVAANTDATKDSRNIQLMAGLQTKNVIGNTSLQGSYSALVSLVGNKTNEVQTLGAAEQSRVDAVTQDQQSESGVNTDEELANMIKYQTAYQAGAKIIQAASDMLNVLFTLGG